MGVRRGIGWALGLAVAILPSMEVDAQPTASVDWRAMAPLPDRRTEVSVATDGRLLYLLGGFARSTNGSAVAPLAVYAYDPATDAWSRLTDLPAGVNHAGLVHLGGALYVVGGFAGSTFRATNRVMIFDLLAGRWREGPPLPTARGALAAVVVDGRIHAIGGTMANGRDTGAHDVFDPATGLWTTAPALPTVRNHMAAAAVGGEIVVLGGRDPRTFTLTANEIYSVATGSWRTGAPVPTGRSGVAVAELGGRVYLFGGEAPIGTFAEAERYDPATDRWERLPDMPTARHGLGAAALGGFIYVVSGGPQPGFTYSDLNERLEVR